MNLKDLIRYALIEDIGSGDITTNLAVDPNKRGLAKLIAKVDGVLSGAKAFNEVFRQLDAKLDIHWSYTDGQRFLKNDTICELEGLASSILTGERTALNFLGRLSGIATLTKRFVDEVKNTNAVILDTRKTTPLLRSLEKEAVFHGGGKNHRQGLYDMILVKDNHEMAVGGVRRVLSRIKTVLERNIKIEVEVQNLDQIDEVMEFHVDRILLDNFDIDMMMKAVKKISGRIPLEVSGNITLENVRDIALTGIDYISVGALTHSAGCSDFSLQMS